MKLKLRNIKVLGYLAQSEVVRFQKSCDLALFTRSSDIKSEITSPLKIFEYFASGIPVVAAKIQVTQLLSAAGAKIFFYDPGSLDSLKNEIRSALSLSSQELGDLKKRNLEIAQNYTWERRQKELVSSFGVNTNG